MQGSSAEAERGFSTAGSILSLKRSKMNGDLLTAIMELSSHYKNE